MSDEAKTDAKKAETEAKKAAAEAKKAEAEGRKAAANKQKWRLFLIVAFVSLIADQATKIWARAELPVVETFSQQPASASSCDIPDDLVPPEKDRGSKCVGVPVGVIDGFWHWRLSMNQGSAFGLFSGRTGARIFLSVVGVLAVFGMLWMLRKARGDQRVLHWALALVAGGAVGNLIDRIYYGVVTDFILWHLGEFKPGPHANIGRWAHEWPVFNIADVVLVVGVGLMFIDIQKEGKREKLLKKARKERQEAAKKKAGLIKDLSGTEE
jgi:signal peptidase II